MIFLACLTRIYHLILLPKDSLNCTFWVEALTLNPEP
jgi:hypothetical protein